MNRSVAVVFAAIALGTTGSRIAFAAETPVNLGEKVTGTDKLKTTLDLDVKGDLIFVVEGKKESVGIEAKARHVFTERVLAVTEWMPSSTARLYDEAASTTLISGERIAQSLPADRKLIVARRSENGLFCFAPAGPLSREELDLVTQHFNPQCLAGLLPGKAVNVGDTWTIGQSTAQTACLLDGVVKTQLLGKLIAVKDGSATFSIEGTTEGLEQGAKVSLAVNATGLFDIASGRITALTWKQKDEREQGPVSPASRMEATIQLRREAVAEFPKELSDEAMAKIPEGDVPAAMSNLRHVDGKGRYTVTHSRDWHVTGQTDTHLVLRLLDRGEFVAQATLSVWRKVEAGKHTAAADFKKAVGTAPGWMQTNLLSEGEVQVATGHWLYRLTAEGKMDDAAVVQAFHLLAGPQGDQLSITVAMKPDRVKAVGTRDLDLVKAVEFAKPR